MYYLVMAWQTNQLRTHPEMVAARTAGQAQQRLSDLYQDLLNIAAVRDRIIENIAEAYANPPAADDELTRLLKPYSGYNFADEIRKALKRKEQELSESSRIDGKSNETGSSDEHD